MTVSAEIEANILRYYHVEKWRVGTIARQLNVHHSVVKRVLAQAGVPKTNLTRHKSLIDSYLPFILETLKRFPTLTASRLYAMVCERGYTGKPDHFRHLISLHRPRPVAIARGNEKGRVERAIRYVRDNFFAARQWKNIDDLNDQATIWCNGQAANRPCPEDTSMMVREVFLQERPKLFALPDNLYPTFDREEVSVGKTPYVRFDLNDYSIPHTHVRRILTVIATNDKVKVLDGQQTIAEHTRSYDKKQQIESKEHINALIDFKKKASQHRAQDRLIKSIPSCAEFLSQAAEHGYSLRTIVKNLLLLLDSYGASELEISIKEALHGKVPHTNAVRFSLEKRRQEKRLNPPVNLDLPNDARIRDLVVRPHKLDDYDQLQTLTGEIP